MRPTKRARLLLVEQRRSKQQSLQQEVDGGANLAALSYPSLTYLHSPLAHRVLVDFPEALEKIQCQTESR